MPDDSPIGGGDAGQSFPRRMGKKGGPANGLSCLNPATTQATCQRFPGLARMLAVHRASQWLSDCMAGMHSHGRQHVCFQSGRPPLWRWVVARAAHQIGGRVTERRCRAKPEAPALAAASYLAS